jgi:hypothetical protein
MSIKPDKLIKSMLGEDFFEVLEKSDIAKINSKSATSIDEMATGLKIVPRAVMSFLISSLSSLEIGNGKDFELPFGQGVHLQITKKDADQYSGYIYKNGKKINEFLDKSIPGVGLILMTSLELYEVEELKEARHVEKQSFDVNKLQEMIDDRLRLHSLICRVVDQKIAQRDAVEILVKEKLAQALKEQEKQEIAEVEEIDDAMGEEQTPTPTKSDKLKQYLEAQKKRREEFEIEKTENIHCPDCGTDLYDGGKNLNLCICYGEDWNKRIKMVKNEGRINMKFPKSMDTENIEMLLQTLKQINKG